MSPAAALAVVLVVLVAVNLWVHLGPPRVHVLTGPLASLLLLLVARGAGLTWSELGLGRADLLTGTLYGAVAGGAIAVVYVVAVAVPYTRGAFRDTRYQLGPGAAVFMALVTIPLATVVFEEVAFRSVLWGLLEVELGLWTAVVVTSALFGLWHVLPGLKLMRTNAALGNVTGARAVLTLLGTVAFTTAAGVVFAELRRRSGSVLAPVILHWATNGLGVLAAARVWTLSERRPSTS